MKLSDFTDNAEEIIELMNSDDVTALQAQREIMISLCNIRF